MKDLTFGELFRRAAEALLARGERCMVCRRSDFIVIRKPPIPEEASVAVTAMLWEVAGFRDERWALQLDVYCANRRHKNPPGWTRFAIFDSTWEVVDIL